MAAFCGQGMLWALSASSSRQRAEQCHSPEECLREQWDDGRQGCLLCSVFIDAWAEVLPVPPRCPGVEHVREAAE